MQLNTILHLGESYLYTWAMHIGNQRRWCKGCLIYFANAQPDEQVGSHV